MKKEPLRMRNAGTLITVVKANIQTWYSAVQVPDISLCDSSMPVVALGQSKQELFILMVDDAGVVIE